MRKTAHGDGLMLSGGTDSAAAAWGAQKHVRRKVLEVIPSCADQAITIVQIACRADMTPEKVRAHLVPLRASGAVEKIASADGYPYRYFKPNGAAPATSPAAGGHDHHEDPMTNVDKLLGALEDGASLTANELADETDVPLKSISPTMKQLYDRGRVDREGTGVSGDPFRYFIPDEDDAGDADADDVDMPADQTPELSTEPADPAIYDDLINHLRSQSDRYRQALAEINGAIVAIERVRDLEAA